MASYRGVVYRVKVFSALYPFGPLPSTDPDKRLTWDQVVQLAEKVQVEKNGVVEGMGFRLPAVRPAVPHPQMAQAMRRASAGPAALGACP